MDELVNRAELDRRIAGVENELLSVATRLSELRSQLGMLTNLRDTAAALEGGVVDDTTFAKPSDAIKEAAQYFLQPTLPRKNVKSTRMVTEVVAAAHRRMLREEIHDAFKQMHGIPEGWQNPSTAINNALARAVDKGLVIEKDGYYWSPEFDAETRGAS